MEEVAEMVMDLAEFEQKKERIFKRGGQEAAVLKDLISRGYTTVRDLLPIMNCPYAVIRDLKKYGIPIESEYRTGKNSRYKVYKLQGGLV